MIMTVTAPQSRSQRGAFISAINITHLPSLRSLSSLLLLFLSRLGSSGSGLLLRSSLLGFLRLIGSLLLFDFTVEKEKIEYEYPGRECKKQEEKIENRKVPKSKFTLGLSLALVLVPLGPQAFEVHSNNCPFSLKSTSGPSLGFFDNQTLLVSVAVGSSPSNTPGIALHVEQGLAFSINKLEDLHQSE